MDGHGFLRRSSALLACIVVSACSETPSAPTDEALAVEAYTYVPTTITAGLGTPGIDGVLTPGEWADAGRIEYRAATPEGRLMPVTWLVMNDAENLYFAVRFRRDANDADHLAYWWFDSDFDGVWGAPGDDAFGYVAELSQDVWFDDRFAIADEGIFVADTDDFGTIDGTAATTRRADGVTIVEVAHPLHSADSVRMYTCRGCSRDLKVSAGEAVGVTMEFGIGPSGQPRVRTWYPPMANSYVRFVRLQTARVGDAVIPVTLDIRPDFTGNAMPCTDPGFIVGAALVADPRFDVTKVDHTTVSLAGAFEYHRDADGKAVRHVTDFDRDGDLDLVFHFRFGDTQLTCTSTEALLAGSTFHGVPVEGRDAVHMYR